MADRKGPLIVTPVRREGKSPAHKPRHRVVCFTWTGGGADFYLQWAEHFPDDIEGTCMAEAAADLQINVAVGERRMMLRSYCTQVC